MNLKRPQVNRFEFAFFSVFDSTTKFPEGLIAGNTYQLGSFDECIGVEARLPGRRATDGRFVGQYCLADVQIIPPEFDRDFHTYDYIKDPNGSAWEGLKVKSTKIGAPKFS
ncbi:hypothetical protein J437_LFUL015952 [Ladona fulva]|uniref:Nose resistant-to-fluoxetine protein N-terminal domain-containing protein n=1 Tax=Ladona fulva TaxID=123851 RepID=A0A8K0JTX4_LADFU|nr:hypothetical protein J437_LFUL015952 [Ladona fulva]